MTWIGLFEYLCLTALSMSMRAHLVRVLGRHWLELSIPPAHSIEGGMCEGLAGWTQALVSRLSYSCVVICRSFRVGHFLVFFVALKVARTKVSH